jgi:hypothetical protein
MLLLAVVSIAAGIDLATFRTSYARTASSSFDLFADWRGYWADLPQQKEEIHDLTLNPCVNWASIMRSDAADFELGVGSNVYLDLSQNLRRDPTYLPSRSAALRWTVDPEATWRYYLWQSDAFAQASGNLRAWFLKEAQDDSSAAHYCCTAWYAEPRGRLAFGYGRIRDAWPLAQALRIADVLEQEGVLAHALSDDELQALAGFISRSWKLFYAHDHAARYYYDSLAVCLTKTGAIDRPLPVYALFRLGEYQAGDFYRPFGWRAYAEIGGSASVDIKTLAEYGSATHYSHAHGSGSSRLVLEYARLFGPRTIITTDLAYTLPWPLALFGWRSHVVAAHAEGRYIATDRLAVILSTFYSTKYAIPYVPSLTRQFEQRGQVGVEVSYYFADRLRVSGSADWSASGGAGYVGGRWVRRMPGRTFSVGADILWGPDSPSLHL